MCYAELKKGRLVGPVGKICFMPRPLYALCDKGTARICLKICHFMVEVTQQPLNHGVRIGEVVLQYGDVRSIMEHRPIGALKRHILVIVQNSDLVLLHLASIPR